MNNRDRNIHIEEIDDESKDHVEEIDTSELTHARLVNTSSVLSESKYQTPVPYNPYATGALSIYNPTGSSQSVPSSIRQQVKETDDSQTAYGEQHASSFGHKKFSPMDPSAPPMEDKDWEEYQAWMNAPSFADRKSFPNHKRWTDILNSKQDSFGLHPEEVFKDLISQKFKSKVERSSSIISGHGLPPSYQAMPPYTPVVFDAQVKHEECYIGSASFGPSVSLNSSSSASSIPRYKPPRYLDQVQDMIDYVDEKHKMSHMKTKLAGQRIANNLFYVVSDHGGKSTGTKFQIWGSGAKESLNLASLGAGQSLGRVEGSAESYETSTHYAHVRNRFTIIRINNNEIGFVFNRIDNRIEKLSTGRYFIPENEFSYIGKSKLAPSAEALKVIPHTNEDPNIVQLAAQLEVVFVSPGFTAFVKDNFNTFMLPENPEPYVLDKRRGESFINYANLNQQLILARDNSYTFVNQLQPGQFVLLKFEGQVVVWEYDEDNIEMNTLHLRKNQFLTDNIIHNTNENRVTWENIDVINPMAGQVVVVQNKERKIRFIETTQANMFVMRMPWKFINFISKNENHYSFGDRASGNETSRIMLRSSEWVAVLDQTGHLSFYPPRMDGQPYYFSQPDHTIVGIVDKNKPGKQEINVPGIGIVSIVNIRSGQIGACRMRNMHFFLNPSPIPYIFMPPDEFIELVDAKASHFANGDLHRIVLAPDEQAVIIKDGALRRLPDDDAALKGENGVYTFRANQFSFQGGGPRKKSEKNCPLGPIHSFIVDVGEKGYGTVNGRLNIWEAGQHYVDNRKNEWFTDFFTTNVDPVEIKDLPVTFKHGITGKIDVFVSYHIDDAEKAIQQFKNHDTLHQFIQTTTSSEMLKLCASRPPLGYTDLDFSANQGRPNDASSVSEVSAGEAVKEMQTSFLIYAKTLLDKYGVSISDMYIHTWTLADDFVKQVQENAKSLQNAHAEVAKAQIAIQKALLENQKEQQNEANKISLQELANKKLALDLEADRLKQENATLLEANKKAANATANAKVKTADAQADADINNLKLKQSTEAEVTKANAELQKNEVENKKALQMKQAAIANQRLENEKLELTLQANKLQQINEAEILAAKKIAEANANAKTAELETQQFATKGKTEAEIQGLKEQARFMGLSPDQRLQLQLAELQMKNMTTLIGMLAQANMQMPGVFTLDPKVLELYQMPAIASAQQIATQRGLGLLGLFPQQPQVPSLSSASVATTNVYQAPHNC